MRFKRSAAVVGATLMIGGIAGTVSAAQGTATLSSNNVQPSGGTVTIDYTGFTPNNIVVINQCVKDGNAGGPFDPNADCSPVGGINPATDATGSGSAEFAVFGGLDANLEEWGCGPDTPAGIPSASTCYIRIAPEVKTNTSEDIFLPITFDATPNPDVPEVPLNVLLPASAAAVLGAGLLVARKRQMASAR